MLEDRRPGQLEVYGYSRRPWQPSVGLNTGTLLLYRYGGVIADSIPTHPLVLMHVMFHSFGGLQPDNLHIRYLLSSGTTTVRGCRPGADVLRVSSGNPQDVARQKCGGAVRWRRRLARSQFYDLHIASRSTIKSCLKAKHQPCSLSILSEATEEQPRMYHLVVRGVRTRRSAASSC
jgi:hypothetical protein